MEEFHWYDIDSKYLLHSLAFSDIDSPLFPKLFAYGSMLFSSYTYHYLFISFVAFVYYQDSCALTCGLHFTLPNKRIY